MKRILFTTFLIIGILSAPSLSLAQVKNLPLIVKTQYFSIYGNEELDIKEVLIKLNFNYLLQVDNFISETNQDLESLLKKTIDALYLEASDVLGIHLYSFHGNIKFCRNQDSLNEVYNDYFKGDFPERSFYLHERNTIYISSPDLTLGMLGHEIAHVIISHYFVIAPSPEVQEILAGYVEYNLRKSTGTLP